MTQFRPTGFGVLPPVIKNLLIINGLMFLAQYTFRDRSLPTLPDSLSLSAFAQIFTLHAYQSSLFEPWQLITHMFMHGSIGHIFGNMLALWMFGAILENIWGSKQFLFFYLLCGLGAAFLHLGITSYEILHATNMYGIDTPTLGASGAVFGILIAFVYLFPNTYIYIYFFLPMKAKWLGIIYFSYELITALQNAPGDGVARWAHVGGAVIGFILVFIWKKNNSRY
jgi:membrane associated rhomboid family serine protease